MSISKCHVSYADRLTCFSYYLNMKSYLLLQFFCNLLRTSSYTCRISLWVPETTVLSMIKEVTQITVTRATTVARIWIDIPTITQRAAAHSEKQIKWTEPKPNQEISREGEGQGGGVPLNRESVAQAAGAQVKIYSLNFLQDVQTQAQILTGSLS